jgi:4'-phosphopantetheinyl transferase EntD
VPLPGATDAGPTGGTARLRSLGIDAERHAPLPNGVLEAIAREDETPVIAKLSADVPDVHWDRLLFSAKESIYKAWYPLARSWLGFEDAALSFDVDAQTFDAVLHRPGPLTAVQGLWLVEDGLVVTSVVVIES